MDVTSGGGDACDEMLLDIARDLHRKELAIHAQCLRLLGLDGCNPTAKLDDRIDIVELPRRHLQPRLASRRQRDLARPHDADSLLDVAGVVYELDLVQPHEVVADGELRHGLFFRASDGRPRLVSAAALEETFGAAGTTVELVVFNACYNEFQVRGLLAHVGCIVGMGGSIGDDAARSFAIGFYGALGERWSVADAYKQGCAAIILEGLHDSERPQLKARTGLDPTRLFLAADPL